MRFAAIPLCRHRLSTGDRSPASLRLFAARHASVAAAQASITGIAPTPTSNTSSGIANKQSACRRCRLERRRALAGGAADEQQWAFHGGGWRCGLAGSQAEDEGHRIDLRSPPRVAWRDRTRPPSFEPRCDRNGVAEDEAGDRRAGRDTFSRARGIAEQRQRVVCDGRVNWVAGEFGLMQPYVPTMLIFPGSRPGSGREMGFAGRKQHVGSAEAAGDDVDLCERLAAKDRICLSCRSDRTRRPAPLGRTRPSSPRLRSVGSRRLSVS